MTQITSSTPNIHTSLLSNCRPKVWIKQVAKQMKQYLAIYPNVNSSEMYSWRGLVLFLWEVFLRFWTCTSEIVLFSRSVSKLNLTHSLVKWGQSLNISCCILWYPYLIQSLRRVTESESKALEANKNSWKKKN